MTTGREELLPISIFACAEAMESIERFPLNPIEMEAGTDREIEGKSAPMVVCPYNAAITEDEYVYFVVQEGAVREVSQNEYSELVDGQRPNNVRTTGSWSINNSLLEAGKGKYLYLLILKRKYKEVERRKCVFSSLYFNGLPVCANA